MPDTLDKLSTRDQIRLLNGISQEPFNVKLKVAGTDPLLATALDIMQINLGKMCNQICHHCHVEAGPHRKEIMSREIMTDCLQALDQSGIRVVDLTGGAPEMNPNFRWFVEELANRGLHMIVRSNLTIVLANPKYHDLPEFFKRNKVELITSLPHFSKLRTDAQRGEGVFEKSIKVLGMLNSVGYGVEGSGLRLNLVYNPTGAMLPPDQVSLERDFKNRLKDRYEIDFNNLLTITNMPISRYLEYLLSANKLDLYMAELVNSFNPRTIDSLMCKSMISVGWDGYLYDCDFNQMLEMRTANIEHIRDFNLKKLLNRQIKTAMHCYGCTAGNGSSCGGELT